MSATGIRRGLQYSSFVSQLREIPPYGGLLMNCGGDLPVVIVDFIVDGHRYVFGTHMFGPYPDCRDSGSQALAKIVNQLMAAFQKEGPTEPVSP